MPHTVWGAHCASIPHKRRSLGTRRPTGYCVVVIAHLILYRRKFEPLKVKGHVVSRFTNIDALWEAWFPERVDYGRNARRRVSREGTQLAMRIPTAGTFLILVVVAAALTFVISADPHPPDRITVAVNEMDRRVDVSIDGQPCTSYIWPTTLKKPVLYPLRTAKGTIVTRGFPLEQRPGERIDHPHHAGLWFNYESVNGIDFWNNSEAIKPENAPKMGTIVHQSVLSAKSGSQQGELDVETDWITFDKTVLLKDEKDGVLGLRVVRALEIPSDKPEVYTDASGRPTTVAKLDNTGVNGTYLTSEGKKGDAAWGTRGRWCNLSGLVGNEPITITILDHPANPGFPTYWHARGY